jgi:ribose transport system substrate-binding protein
VEKEPWLRSWGRNDQGSGQEGFLALVMPLVTADKVDSPEPKAVIARVFPPAK